MLTCSQIGKAEGFGPSTPGSSPGRSATLKLFFYV